MRAIIRGIIEAIKAGMFHESMKGEMTALETHEAELTALLGEAPRDMPDMRRAPRGFMQRRSAA